MVKFFKVALLLMLASCTPAYAQSFPQPPDVEAYETVTETYATGSDVAIVGNGIAADGGTMEVTSDSPAAINLSDTTPWVETGSFSLCALIAEGGSCSERKFRTHIHASHNGNNDPIRNYGQAGSSHCHTFFGNAGTNAFSTYASLRTRNTSTAGGGRMNGTGYWHPCMKKGSRVVMPFIMVVYYKDTTGDVTTLKSWPRAFRYVFGFPMDDPTGAIRKGYLTTANAAAPGRYRFQQDSSVTASSDVGKIHGALGWQCLTSAGATVTPVTGGDANGYVPSFVLSGGIDPWGGNCPSDGTASLLTAVEGPKCIDGKNLWSPGGYKHTSLGLWDATNNRHACPQGWFKVAPVEISFKFKHYGFADFSTWSLSSDTPAGTQPGGSFHTDWMDGWDTTARETGWELNCIGIGDTVAPRGAECSDSQFALNKKLLVGGVSPDTGLPQLETDSDGRDGSDTAVTASMPVLPATANPSGNQTVHVHGN